MTLLGSQNSNYRRTVINPAHQKFFQALYSNKVTSDNKRIHTPFPSPPIKVGVFVVFYRQLEQRHNTAWRGWREKLYFPLLKLVKCQKAPLGQSVSTNFVVNCIVKGTLRLVNASNRLPEWQVVNTELLYSLKSI